MIVKPCVLHRYFLVFSGALIDNLPQSVTDSSCHISLQLEDAVTDLNCFKPVKVQLEPSWSDLVEEEEEGGGSG